MYLGLVRITDILSLLGFRMKMLNRKSSPCAVDVPVHAFYSVVYFYFSLYKLFIVLISGSQ
jgi:hypothetical protein